MRKSERERLVKRYNDIVDYIEMLDMSDYYIDFEELSTADANEMDNEEVTDLISDLDINLDYLEGDLEFAISDITTAISKIKQLKETKLADLLNLCDKYET